MKYNLLVLIFLSLMITSKSYSADFKTESNLNFKFDVFGKCSSDIKKKTYESARKSCLVEAKKGNDSAVQNITFLYWKGHGGSVNDKEAFKWCLVGAKSNIPTMMNWLGHFYKTGFGTKIDFEKALKWFSNAADSGWVDGFYNAGLIYEKQKKYKSASHMYIKGYNLDDYHALMRLAVLHVNGQGVEKDIKKAYAYAAIADAKGVSDGAKIMEFISKRVTPENLKILKEYARKNLEKFGLTSGSS